MPDNVESLVLVKEYITGMIIPMIRDNTRGIMNPPKPS